MNIKEFHHICTWMQAQKINSGNKHGHANACKRIKRMRPMIYIIRISINKSSTPTCAHVREKILAGTIRTIQYELRNERSLITIAGMRNCQ